MKQAILLFVLMIMLKSIVMGCERNKTCNSNLKRDVKEGFKVNITSLPYILHHRVSRKVNVKDSIRVADRHITIVGITSKSLENLEKRRRDTTRLYERKEIGKINSQKRSESLEKLEINKPNKHFKIRKDNSNNTESKSKAINSSDSSRLKIFYGEEVRKKNINSSSIYPDRHLISSNMRKQERNFRSEKARTSYSCRYPERKLTKKRRHIRSSKDVNIEKNAPRGEAFIISRKLSKGKGIGEPTGYFHRGKDGFTSHEWVVKSSFRVVGDKHYLATNYGKQRGSPIGFKIFEGEKTLKNVKNKNGRRLNVQARPIAPPLSIKKDKYPSVNNEVLSWLRSLPIPQEEGSTVADYQQFRAFPKMNIQKQNAGSYFSGTFPVMCQNGAGIINF
ncbi:uncharacterized protein [Centruroides vittatus]|uniref:uncharacterized protein isoform X1 n=1 Tax=Centruroides vittatus TaxID=120091 RepID=UPI00350EF0DB